MKYCTYETHQGAEDVRAATVRARVGDADGVRVQAVRAVPDALRDVSDRVRRIARRRGDVGGVRDAVARAERARVRVIVRSVGALVSHVRRAFGGYETSRGVRARQGAGVLRAAGVGAVPVAADAPGVGRVKSEGAAGGRGARRALLRLSRLFNARRLLAPTRPPRRTASGGRPT
eukprot:30806-Pelagococcus_subviridis.AAC.5